MAANVNLDALIPREDFEVISDGEAMPNKRSITIFELQGDNFFFKALRKPDFQRETIEWTPKRVLGLIRSFVEDELIPAVILWPNERGLNFVVDGSHRLSALIAWVQNDYGDGEISRPFFGHDIEDEQKERAKKTRAMVEKAFGSYADHVKAIENPESYGPDIVNRARRFARLSLDLQWVRGDANKAEESFKRINQQAAMITPLELELINSRRKPNAIAARAILRRGTGHKYWKAFGPPTQDRIEELAAEMHSLMFEPKQEYPLKSAELPAGGPVSSSTALSMVYGFTNLAAGVVAAEDDKDGQRTVDYLTRCRRVMNLLVSSDNSSLGLHPAVYFYSWTGKQQPILFLVIAQLMVDFEQRKKLPWFTEVRGRLEFFLINNRALINQLVRKYGTKDSGTTHLRKFYEDILEMLSAGNSNDEILKTLMETYKYLQPGEALYDGNEPKKVSTQVKSGIVLRDGLKSTMRCQICDGFVPMQAISIDHKRRIADDGSHGAINLQVTHPFCNHGYKEQKHSTAQKTDKAKI
jgi:hypothetical protein